MKNLLFVSIAFPPKNDPESLQAAKYFKYLVRNKIAIDVITSKLPTLWMEADENLKEYSAGIRQLIEIPITEPKYLSIFVGKYGKFARKPDTRMHFHWQWRKAVGQLKEKPDVLYSRSFPLSSTIMALKLKKYYKIPWILHLSDPWADSPIFNFKNGEKNYHNKFERECFELADKISLTSTHSIDLYRKKYPDFKNKFLFCPNVYDDDDITDNKHTKNEKMRILYTGSLNGSRSVKYIERAIQIIKEKSPSALDKIEFLFAGSVDSENAVYFNRSEYLKHSGLLSFAEVKKMQQAADVLLAIDSLFDQNADAVFFPSKILDYLITHNPILAITNNGSMTYEVVNNRYGKCVAHHDYSAIADQILRYFEDWSENKSIRMTNKIDRAYSAGENAKWLYDAIEKL